MTAIPEGYVTRARADHLTEELIRGIRDITDRFAARASERCAMVDAATALAILEEEAQRTVREVEALQADVKAQLLGSNH